MEFSLKINIKPDDLSVINTTGMLVSLAKPVNTGKPNVIWVTLKPYQTNEITWTEEYGIYAAAQTELQNGATINKMTELPPPVSNANAYFFQNGLFQIDSNTPTPADGSFLIVNRIPKSESPFTIFGLTQTPVIGGKPQEPAFINAAPVMAQLHVTFQPLTTIYVWIQNRYTSGTVITDIESDAVALQFSSATPTHTIRYDGDKGYFVNDAVDNAANTKYHFRKGVYRLE
jgi:hypothetical protein